MTSVSSFGGVQAIPAFRNQFGDCNAAGVCSLSTTTAAIVRMGACGLAYTDQSR